MSYDGPFARYVEASVEALRAIVPALNAGSPFFGQLHYHLGWANEAFEPDHFEGGKRIRPVFCLIACELTAGTFQPALAAAAAVELLHQFSLIHDDIEDGDETRHHRPTLWKLVGQPQAINAGDALFALAQLALLRSTQAGTSAETVLRAQIRFNETALALCKGQFLDMNFETREWVSPEEYIEMIRGKTAALLAFAGELGALMGGADEDLQRNLFVLGESLGLAFQMRDDLLGLWGDPDRTGKPVGADIRAKKKSLPVTFALTRDSTGELRALYRGALESDAEITRARFLIEQSGAREEVEALASRYEAEALTILENLDAPESRLVPLRQLADQLAARTY